LLGVKPKKIKVLMNLNLLFNFSGQIYTAIVTIMLLPAITSLLGPEQYGVWGFYLTLSAWLLFLEGGITPAIGRKISSLRYIRDFNGIKILVRSAEFFLIIVGIAILLVGLFSSGLISKTWLNAEYLDPNYIEQSLKVMFFIIFITFFENLYRSCLYAIEKHVFLNVIMIAIVSLRTIGGFLLLNFDFIELYGFVCFHLFSSFLSCVILMISIYFYANIQFFEVSPSLKSLMNIKNFAGGVFIITILGSIVSQLDKFMLSAIVSLESFGVYAFCSALAMGALKLVSPITQTFYPKFVGHFTKNDKHLLRKYFHLSAQLVIFIFGSASVCIFYMGNDLIFALSGDVTLSSESESILRILILGTLISGILWVPYHMQLAYEALKVPLIANSVGLVLMIPLVYFLGKNFGTEGVSYSWLILNLGYLFISMPIAFQYVMRSEMARWYFWDNIFPIIFLFLLVFLYNLIVPSSINRFFTFLRFIFIFFLTTLSILFFLPNLKKEFKMLIKKLY
tara:strand:+ start:12191 stop:13714 length:1524 start_codon:yes stop_codon:yes gene_type:complete